MVPKNDPKKNCKVIKTVFLILKLILFKAMFYESDDRINKDNILYLSLAGQHHTILLFSDFDCNFDKNYYSILSLYYCVI